MVHRAYLKYLDPEYRSGTGWRRRCSERQTWGRGWGAGVNRRVGGGEGEILGIDSDSQCSVWRR